MNEHMQKRYFEFKTAKENYKWLKSINSRFKKMINSGSSIEITEWHDFSQGASYLDIQIKLPPRLKDLFYYAKDICRYFKEKFITRDGWASPVMSFKHCVTPQFRWIVTILTKGCLKEAGIENLLWDDDLLYLRFKKILGEEFKPHDFEKDPTSLFRFIDDNSDQIFSDGPIITFDYVYTNKDILNKEDAIEFTRLWLHRFYPELQNRQIIFKDQ